MRDAPDSTATVVVDVVYLARLREAFGASQERLALAEDAEPTVAGVLATLRARGGAWAAELAAGRAVRVAVNHTMARPDTPVEHGDEVAVLPPVTGG